MPFSERARADPVEHPARRVAALDDIAVQYALMLLADARLPAGGHTMSGGLEPAIQAGLTVAEVPAYLRGRLVGTLRVDAGTAVVARHACAAGHDAMAVADAWAARTPTQTLRDAGHVAGRGLHRVLSHLAGGVEWPARRHRAAALRARAWLEPLVREHVAWRPVVLGALAGSLGLDAGRTALLLAYDDVQTVTAAALKLLPLDPLAALDWSLGVREEIARLVADLADLTDPDDIPADSAPALEAWHHVHSLADRRLFRA